MTEHTMRQAKPADLTHIERLWDDARAWLHGNESNQWQYPMNRPKVESSIAAGECWLLEEDAGPDILGTITVDNYADPDFWTAEDNPGSALYAHRMISSRAARRRGIGRELLDFADELARRAGKELLRLDAWRTNVALHAYYLAQGFQLVRIVDRPGRNSGALFERAVAPRAKH